jgi:CrcB protein
MLVFVGGGLGSLSRYLFGVWMAGQLGSAFPWSTLTINVAGSFLIGLVATLADEARLFSTDQRTFLVVGVLGGFTTFSSFALESSRLWEAGSLVRASAYIVGTAGLGGLAVVLGIALGRAVS